jgi:ribosome-associated translation inhibitor RaiA
MQIQVVGEDPINAQARIYAEYRFFATLTQSDIAAEVDHVRVVVRPLPRPRDGADMSCAVTVGFDHWAPLRIRTTGAHAYAAIDRAVERVRAAIKRGVASR